MKIIPSPIGRFIGLLSIWLLTGCVKENLAPALDNSDQGDQIEVTIRYRVPGMSTVTTKAHVLTEAVQATIETGFIIAYEVQPDGTELYAYYRQIAPEKLADQQGSGSFSTLMVKSKNAERYTFDFVFNADSQVWDELEDAEYGMTTRQEIRESVRHTLYAYSVGQSNTSSIPCWGTYEPPMEITHSTVLPELKILRSFARIDVGLDFDENEVARGLDNFTLEYVFIQNAAYINLIGHPECIENGIAKTPYYTGSHTNALSSIGGVSITNDYVVGGFFVGESSGERYASGHPLYTTCLILVGFYKEGGSLSTERHYYRVDLKDPDNPEKNIDLLRNHKYRVNILGIDGPSSFTSTATAGLDIQRYTAEVARNPSELVRYELTVQEDEGEINHVVYSGTQFLGVSTNEYISGVGSPSITPTFDLKVKTNVAAGWELVSLTDGAGTDLLTDSDPWIVPDILSGTSGVTENIRFTLVPNTGGDPRLAFAGFSAGILTLTVYITQPGGWQIGILLTDSERMLLGDGDQVVVFLNGTITQNVYVRAYSLDDDLQISPDAYTVFPAGSYPAPFQTVYEDLVVFGNAILPHRIRQVQFQWTYDPSDHTSWVPFAENQQL